jgi:hypothetical protein
MMKRKPVVPANENLELRETFQAKFPPPRTASGNPITHVCAEWVGEEDFLYTGRSAEGFHAHIVAIGDEHKLHVWNPAFPTAKEASDAALRITQKPKSEPPEGSR